MSVIFLQVHAFIIAELRKQMPTMIGKEKKKKELIQNLDKIFEQLQVCVCVCVLASEFLYFSHLF